MLGLYACGAVSNLQTKSPNLRVIMRSLCGRVISIFVMVSHTICKPDIKKNVKRLNMEGEIRCFFPINWAHNLKIRPSEFLCYY